MGLGLRVLALNSDGHLPRRSLRCTLSASPWNTVRMENDTRTEYLWTHGSLPMLDGRNMPGPASLSAGNTGAGIYKNWPHEDIIIDIKRVQQLRTILYNPVGALCSIP